MSETTPARHTPAKLMRSRRHSAGSSVRDKGAEALLLTNLKNIQYLTGFSGSNAAMLLRADGTSTLATDGRYATQIRQQTGEPEDLRIIITNNVVQELADLHAHENPGGVPVHIEASMPVGEAAKLESPQILAGVVEAQRLVKDEVEVDKLLAAGQLADQVWQAFIAEGGIQEGIPESQAAADLEYRLRHAGADALSFETILASGVRGSKPHAGASREIIVPGLVTVDFGVYLDGYASDQTRTVCVGQPSQRDYELFETVYRAQKAGEATLRPGVALREVDAACRDIIDAAGYGEFFVHSTGHGVGLDVHEAPRAAKGVDASEVLREGMTLTVEPGIYLPGETGARIENTYVITAEGARSCNISPTELIVL